MTKQTPVFILKVDGASPRLETLPKEDLGEALSAMQTFLEHVFGKGNVYAELNLEDTGDGKEKG